MLANALSVLLFSGVDIKNPAKSEPDRAENSSYIFKLGNCENLKTGLLSASEVRQITSQHLTHYLGGIYEQ